jgi:hypothetical protein
MGCRVSSIPTLYNRTQHIVLYPPYQRSLLSFPSTRAPASMSFYLAIVSPSDIPLYEIQFQSQSQSQSSSSSLTPTSNSNSTTTNSSTSSFPSWSSFTTSSGADLNPTSGSNPNDNASASAPSQHTGIERHLAQMVAFASLDSVDEILEGTGNLYVDSLLWFSLGLSSTMERGRD